MFESKTLKEKACSEGNPPCPVTTDKGVGELPAQPGALLAASAWMVWVPTLTEGEQLVYPSLGRTCGFSLGSLSLKFLMNNPSLSTRRGKRIARCGISSANLRVQEPLLN